MNFLQVYCVIYGVVVTLAILGSSDENPVGAAISLGLAAPVLLHAAGVI